MPASHSVSDAYLRGQNHGYDAANYALSYGTEETTEAEAQRRAAEYFPDDKRDRTEYQNGFLTGWEDFEADQDESD